MNRKICPLFFLIIITSFSLVSSSDSGLMTICGGTEDLVILCLNNNELDGDYFSPVITLISPEDGTEDTDGEVIFLYNVTDESNISNCSLYFDNIFNRTSINVTRNITNNFTVKNIKESSSLSWKIICTDIYGNIGTSETRIIDTDYGSGTGAGTSGQEINLSYIELFTDNVWEYGINNEIIIETYDSDGNYVNVDNLTIKISPNASKIYSINKENIGIYSVKALLENRSANYYIINVTAYQLEKSVSKSISINMREQSIISRIIVFINDLCGFVKNNIYKMSIMLAFFLILILFFIIFGIKKNKN